MGGNVLYLDSDFFKPVENLLMILEEKGKVNVEEIRFELKPITKQAALGEQTAIIKMIADKEGAEKTAELFGYDISLIKEIMELNENEEYDYSCIKELRTISKHNR